MCENLVLERLNLPEADRCGEMDFSYQECVSNEQTLSQLRKLLETMTVWNGRVRAYWSQREN